MASPARLYAAAGYTNFLVLGLAGFLVNPVLLGVLGATGFGAWTAARRYLDFAVVADGRAPQALKWVIASRAGTGAEAAVLRRDVGASVLVCLIWLPIAAVACLVLVWALPSLVRGLEPIEVPALVWAGSILAANVVLGGLLAIPDAVLVGANQGYRSMVVTTVSLIVSNVAMLLAVSAGFGIVGLAVVVVSAAILNGLATWLVARRSVKWWGMDRPDRVEVSTLARFSGWVLGSELVTKLYLSTEVVLLGVLIGAGAVTAFAFTSYIAQFALSICLMTTSAFMPSLGALLGQRQSDAARVVRDARHITLAIATVAGCAVLILNQSFIDLWVGPEHFLGSTANALMVLALVQLAMIRSDSQVLDTGLKIRNKVLVSATGALLGLLIPLVLYALTQSLPWLLAGIVLGRLAVSMALPVLVKSVVPTAQFGWRAHVFAGLMLLISYFVGLEVRIENILLLCVSAIVAAAVLTAAAALLILPTDTRARLLRFGRAGGSREP